jgi:hypothetical protein
MEMSELSCLVKSRFAVNRLEFADYGQSGNCSVYISA